MAAISIRPPVPDKHLYIEGAVARIKRNDVEIYGSVNSEQKIYALNTFLVTKLGFRTTSINKTPLIKLHQRLRNS